MIVTFALPDSRKPIRMYFTKYLSTLLGILFAFQISTKAQTGDCPYPVIFVHGWVSDDTYWEGTSKDADFNNVWGNYAGTWHAVINATDTHERNLLGGITAKNDDINGPDGTFDNDGMSDDVMWIFPNEDNVLTAGCVYGINFNNGLDNDGNLETYSLFNDAPCGQCSDSNESAIVKQGYALSKAIQAVLTANPDKDKVILVGHSMGGLCSREYLQRTDDTGNPKNWIDPSSADGHKVAKLVTVGTPHRGSNSFGNMDPLRLANFGRMDVNFDLRSEAIRDLRVNYAAASGPDVAGAYLFGGDEADIPDYFPWYWSEDVNCDGDEDDTIIGINESGSPKAWDGTEDNPSMPLPTNVRYTYYVSNILLSGGDGVVEDDRQWIFRGGDGITTGGYNDGSSVPVPHDGVDYRLSDRVDGTFGTNHGGQSGDAEKIMQALDEGDYPAFAWRINMNHTYAGMAQENPAKIPADGNRAGGTDRDWYVFSLDAPSQGLNIKVTPNPDLAGRIDLFENPADYELGNALISLTFPSGTTTEQELKAIACEFPAGEYYVRVSHEAVGSADWKNAFTLRVETTDVDIPSTTGSYIADNETTDRNGWTHYWKSAINPSSNDLLLLSIQKDAGMDIVPSQVMIGVGGSSAIDLGTAGYVPNNTIWHVMDRWWDATPTVQPSANVGVRFYYNDPEFLALQSAVQGDGGIMASRADMVAYKFETGSGVDPNPGNGHTGGTAGNFLMLPHSDLLCMNKDYAEFSVTGFSGGGLGGSFDILLPVELISFTGKAREHFNLIQWETALEENIELFELQYSNNGIDFIPLSTISPSGNDQGQEYRFEDKNVEEEKRYYRLKIIESDGSFSFSNIISVERKSKDLVFSITPNPVKDFTQINMELNESGQVEISVFDFNGKLISKEYFQGEKGTNQFRLNTYELAKGIYILQATQGEKITSKKLIK